MEDAGGERMRQMTGLDYHEEFFPEGVGFLEPEPPADYKREIFRIHPETRKQGQSRGITLVELMNHRVRAKSQYGEKKICYLIVSHSIFVDSAACALDFLKQNSDVIPASAFKDGLSEKHRGQLLAFT